MDAAHKYTDEVLAEIEKRVAAEYGAALVNIDGKFDEYTEEFRGEYEKKIAQLQSGDITEDEYILWLEQNVTSGRKYLNLLNDLACILTFAGLLAMGDANTRLPDVYAENKNFGSYQVEYSAKPEISFSLLDRETVKNLSSRNPNLYPQASVDIPKDLRWNRQHLNSAIRQGILNGESIPKIAKRLQTSVGMGQATALRAARTCTTAAENLGRLEALRQAKAMGINVQKRWMATLDGRTRHTHRILDGETIDIEEKFSNGLMYPGDNSGDGKEFYNCRCTMLGIIDGQKVTDRRMDKLNESYEEWKKGGARQNKTSGRTMPTVSSSGVRTSYSQRELSSMSREQLETIAREVAKNAAPIQGISEEEAVRRFELLMSVQTDEQLRKYINQNGQ